MVFAFAGSASLVRASLKTIWAFFACLCLATCLSVFSVAKALGGEPDLPNHDAREIRSVIERQVNAFKRDDAAGAYSFAAPGIQTVFPNAEVFMQMIRQGYQPVYRPRLFKFDELTTIEGKVVQSVRVVGPDGLPVIALYIMEQQPDGSWRIGGCVLKATPGQGV